MDQESHRIYIMSQITCAFIEAIGMVVHDLHELQHGQGQVYTEASYQSVIDKYGIDHNGVIGYLTGK